MPLYESTLRSINDGCLSQALAILPGKMDSLPARAQLLKTTLQESLGTMRRQMGNGPARGLWQFEQGSNKSRAGVWGVFMHAATRDHLQVLCAALKVTCQPDIIYNALEHNDVLAAGVARLNYWWVAGPIPAINDCEHSWLYYKNTWNPGKPRHETWAEYHFAVLHYLVAQ